MDFPSLETDYGCLQMITLQKGSHLHLNPFSAWGVIKEIGIFSPDSYYNDMKKKDLNIDLVNTTKFRWAKSKSNNLLIPEKYFQAFLSIVASSLLRP